MVRAKGLEPSWGCPHTDLNRTRLPIPPHPRGFLRSELVLYPKRFMDASIFFEKSEIFGFGAMGLLFGGARFRGRYLQNKNADTRPAFLSTVGV